MLARSADGDRLGTADLPLREDVPPGRHPREGRPGEHGVLARGARAVPRRRARRVPRPRSLAAQAPPPRHEAPAQAGDGATSCRPGSRPARRRASESRSPRGSRASSARRSRTSSRRERLRRQGLFEPAEVERLMSEHLSGRRDHRKPLWTLFVFQLWHRRWLEGSGQPRRPRAARRDRVAILARR